MTLLTTLTRTAGLGLCVVAFAGTALADPGNGNGPAVTPPGQEKKAETTAAPAPAAAPAAAPENKGQEKKAEQQQAKADRKADKATPKPATAPAAASKGQAKKAEQAAPKAAKPATTSGSYKATSSGTDLKQGMSHKHTICHATGSESNPYVRITPSVSGVYNGHIGHQDDEDIVPPFTYKGTTYSQNWDAEGQAIFNAGCAVPSPPAPAPATTPTTTQQSGECPTTTTTSERVLVGIWHATGAMKDGRRKFVFISPSEKSAHFDKHEDDVPVYETRTVATTASNESCEKTVAQTPPTAPTPPAPGAPEQPQPIVPTPAGQTPAPGTVGVLPAVTPPPAGAVLGAVSPTQAPAADEQPAGGVLGAVASAPEAIARTATSGTLPFTGLPLWIAALLSAGLLTVGLALRRSA